MQEVNDFYKGIVSEISKLIPKGSVSIEVAANASTVAESMMKQAREMYTWIPNAHIKLPTTAEGLKAARECVDEGIRINMTLVFSQEQAAAVYAATTGAKKGDVFLSPFIGRLDDRGENGMDLIKNILEMYRTSDGHVELLTASVRSLDHFNAALALKSDIMTVPGTILRQWNATGMTVPEKLEYKNSLKAIPFQMLDLTQSSESFNIRHELTDAGLAKFAEDWGKLIVP